MMLPGTEMKTIRGLAAAQDMLEMTKDTGQLLTGREDPAETALHMPGSLPDTIPVQVAILPEPLILREWRGVCWPEL